MSFTGELLWTRPVSNLWFNDTFEHIEDLVLDQNNNSYITGAVNNSNSGDRRMALAKYNSEGQLLEAYIHPTAGLWGESMKIMNDEIITISRGFPSGLVSLIKFDFNFELR